LESAFLLAPVWGTQQDSNLPRIMSLVAIIPKNEKPKTDKQLLLGAVHIRNFEQEHNISPDTMNRVLS